MKPTIVYYALGTGGKAVPVPLDTRSLNDLRARLEKQELRRAADENREPEAVYVWESSRADVVDLRLVRALDRRMR